MLALKLTLFSVAAVMRAALLGSVDEPEPEQAVGALDFSDPDNSGLLALLEDI